ncbi:gluconate:H+ symporter, GntP family [Marisediminitalea aggregata]|uniref:Gluconate:H+ symporter, GntP family n=2 Tax=Marisediminitalea aggregata TaxID=634436 RepID=A0A1M5Q876_9ALTE|nr:GntP family permease [Marisediminitalea aggregata]SHH09969.1 gluconate:H+ symporter, GntP family [Marisediminitalea aggregata]
MLLFTGLAMILTLMFLVIVVRMHAFIALILVSLITAVFSGVNTADIVPVMLSGFGGTLAAVALLVGLGGMIGKLLDASGGAEVLAKRLVDLFGEQRAPLALGVASLLFGFPIFFDAGLIVMMPILLTVARKLAISTLSLVLPAAGAFAVMHAFVPPHPGPVAAADLLGVNMGLLLLVGVLVAIPTWYLGGYLYGLYAGTTFRLPVPAWFTSQSMANTTKTTPSFSRVLAILLTPFLLISLDTVANTLLTSGVLTPNDALSAIRVLGKTPVALLITLLLTLWLLRVQFTRTQLESLCNDALGPLCAVILITGAGGMFGGVLRASGIGNALAELLADTGLPIIVAAFVLSSCIRVAQGSATVALTTTAALLAPVVSAQTGLSAMDLCCIVIAIAGGATVLSHVNDSGFWLVSRLLEMDEKTTLKTWTVMETLLGSIAFMLAALLSWLF